MERPLLFGNVSVWERNVAAGADGERVRFVEKSEAGGRNVQSWIEMTEMRFGLLQNDEFILSHKMWKKSDPSLVVSWSFVHLSWGGWGKKELEDGVARTRTGDLQCVRLTW